MLSNLEKAKLSIDDKILNLKTILANISHDKEYFVEGSDLAQYLAILEKIYDCSKNFNLNIKKSQTEIDTKIAESKSAIQKSKDRALEYLNEISGEIEEVKEPRFESHSKDKITLKISEPKDGKSVNFAPEAIQLVSNDLAPPEDDYDVGSNDLLLSIENVGSLKISLDSLTCMKLVGESDIICSSLDATIYSITHALDKDDYSTRIDKIYRGSDSEILCTSGSEKYIVGGSFNGDILLWQREESSVYDKNEVPKKIKLFEDDTIKPVSIWHAEFISDSVFCVATSESKLKFFTVDEFGEFSCTHTVELDDEKISYMLYEHERLMMCTNQGAIYEFDNEKGALRQITSINGCGFSSIAIKPEKNYIAAADFNTSIKIYDLRTPDFPSGHFVGHTDIVSDMKFWGDDYFLSGGNDGILRLWDARITVDCVSLAEDQAHFHKNDVSLSSLLTLNEKCCITCGYDGKINFYQMSSY